MPAQTPGLIHQLEILQATHYPRDSFVIQLARVCVCRLQGCTKGPPFSAEGPMVHSSSQLFIQECHIGSLQVSVM